MPPRAFPLSTRRLGLVLMAGALAVGGCSGSVGSASGPATDGTTPSPSSETTVDNDDAIEIVDYGFTTSFATTRSGQVPGRDFGYGVDYAVVIENHSAQVAEQVQVLVWLTEGDGPETPEPVGHPDLVTFVLPGQRTAVAWDAGVQQPARSMRVAVEVGSWSPAPAGFPTVTVGPASIGRSADGYRQVSATAMGTFPKPLYAAGTQVAVWRDAEGAITGGSEGPLEELYPEPEPSLLSELALDDDVPIVSAEMYVRLEVPNILTGTYG